jgi:PhnB protein
MEKVLITREFNAPVELVWEAWTKAENISEWWGPKGYTTTVKEHDFRPGGRWEYVMVAEDGKEYPAVGVFKEIVPFKKLVSTDEFDEAFNSMVETDRPKVLMFTTLFEGAGDRTKITLLYELPTKADKDKFLAMGVEGGWSTSFDKLTFYIQTQQTLRKQLNTTAMARVTTYLNFPGNTEEAFIFYKNVFRSEFNGGMQRFGDIPAQEGMPPLSDADKKLIIHVELPIVNGHILMATDAPASMGFTLTPGNNMNISLDLDSKEETTRLFNELSAGGTITMELQDMFWGAYYGSCTDKFGINWMFNFKQN